jgi:hypothetical protein
VNVEWTDSNFIPGLWFALVPRPNVKRKCEIEKLE